MAAEHIPKSAIEALLQTVSKEVDGLKNKINEMNAKLAKAEDRLQAIQKFYHVEYGSSEIPELEDSKKPSIKSNNDRFKDMTIRQVCRQLLRENGAMHVSEIYRKFQEHGRNTAKTSITSTLIRKEKDFERVQGKENTFRLKEEMLKGEMENGKVK